MVYGNIAAGCISHSQGHFQVTSGMFPARRYWRDPPSADVNASAKFYKALLNPLADHWAKLWTMDRRGLPWLGFCGLLWLIVYLYYFLLNLYENPFCECAPARPAELLVLAAVSTKKLRKMVDGERLVKDDQWYQLDLSTVHGQDPKGYIQVVAGGAGCDAAWISCFTRLDDPHGFNQMSTSSR